MNKNKSIPFIIALVVLVAGLGVVMTTQTSKPVYKAENTNTSADTITNTTNTPLTPTGSTVTPVTTTPSTPKSTPKPTPSPTPKPTVNSYTFAQVSMHNNASDCWTTINGGVYNVTSWIDQHPGGAEAIIQLCGVDGSGSFNDQHGGQRRPESELTSFKIGVLK